MQFRRNVTLPICTWLRDAYFKIAFKGTSIIAKKDSAPTDFYIARALLRVSRTVRCICRPIAACIFIMFWLPPAVNE